MLFLKKTKSYYSIRSAAEEESGHHYERYYAMHPFDSEKEARDYFVRKIEKGNTEFGGLFSKLDPKKELEDVKFVKIRNKWWIRSAIKKKRVRKVYEYTTSKELGAKQQNNYVGNIGHAMDSVFSKIVDVPVKDIYPTEKTDAANVAQMVEAIKAGDELPPLLLDGGYGIIDGHHRLEAAKKLKLKTVPCIFYYNPDEDEEIKELTAAVCSDPNKYEIPSI